MNKSNVIELEGRVENTDPLTELLRNGARHLLQQAIEAELQELLASHSDRVLEDGKAGVVHNGHLPARAIQTGIGPVTEQISKVRAETGEPVTFHSALLPPYVRKTKALEAALPWLYQKGVSSGEMDAALEVLVGPQAKGLSANTVSRLKRCWAEEYQAWREAPLDVEHRIEMRIIRPFLLVPVWVDARMDHPDLGVVHAGLIVAIIQNPRRLIGFARGFLARDDRGGPGLFHLQHGRSQTAGHIGAIDRPAAPPATHQNARVDQRIAHLCVIIIRQARQMTPQKRQHRAIADGRPVVGHEGEDQVGQAVGHGRITDTCENGMFS